MVVDTASTTEVVVSLLSLVSGSPPLARITELIGVIVSVIAVVLADCTVLVVVVELITGRAKLFHTPIITEVRLNLLAIVCLLTNVLSFIYYQLVDNLLVGHKTKTLSRG